jgi:hypothetical protein
MYQIDPFTCWRNKRLITFKGFRTEKLSLAREAANRIFEDLGLVVAITQVNPDKATSSLLTKDGRVPKQKWVVIRKGTGRISSRHQYKSAAMDRALTNEHRSGGVWEVCEIYNHPKDGPILAVHFDTKDGRTCL